MRRSGPDGRKFLLHCFREPTNVTARRRKFRRPKIALLIESSRAYGRGVLRGIAGYARTHGPWSIYHQERALGDAAPAWMKKWSGDGLIVSAESERLVEHIQRLRVPVVDIRGLYQLPGVPVVQTDNHQVVRLALEHLENRGFRKFAFCGFAGIGYSELRLRLFRELLAQTGREPSVFEGPREKRGADTMAIEARGLLQEQELSRWIASLSKPVGLLACNDIRAQQLLNACRSQGVAVPEEVAVIGVDNDDVLCELCDPPLSSVEPDTEGVGYQAAAVLDELLAGRSASEPIMLIPPRGVVTRRSSDVLAISDQLVAAAVRFIREHARDGINVHDVLAHVGLARGALERRFTRLMGRPPKAEILRVRLERVKQLLTETDFTLPVIARLSGFVYSEYMIALFRAKTGQTPGQFRQATQREDARNRPR